MPVERPPAGARRHAKGVPCIGGEPFREGSQARRPELILRARDRHHVPGGALPAAENGHDAARFNVFERMAEKEVDCDPLVVENHPLERSLIGADVRALPNERRGRVSLAV